MYVCMYVCMYVYARMDACMDGWMAGCIRREEATTPIGGTTSPRPKTVIRFRVFFRRRREPIYELVCNRVA